MEDDNVIGACGNIAMNNLALSGDANGRQHVIDVKLIPTVANTKDDADKEVNMPPSYSVSTLPPGWEAKKDDWGRVFYVDHNRGITQWEAHVPDAIGDEAPGTFHRLRTSFAPTSASTYDAAGAPRVNAVTYHGCNKATSPRVPPPNAPPANGSMMPVRSSHRSLGTVYPDTYAPMEMLSDIQRTFPLRLPDDAEVFDWSVLTQAQLDDVPCVKLDTASNIKGFGLWGSFKETLARNTCFFVISVVVWTVITVGTYFSVTAALGPESVGAFAFSQSMSYVGMAYFGWTLFITLPVGCMCGYLRCCTFVSSGSCVRDKPVEALRAPVAEDMSGFRQYFAELHSGAPVITLHVRCSHTTSSGSGKRRRTHTVVTYSNSRSVAVERWKDISVPQDLLEQAIHQHAADNICISYECSYHLHPSQAPLIEALRQQYYEENKHRDRTTIVTVTYTTNGYQENHVDVIAKRGTWHYRIYCICCNWFTFYLSVWTTLYFFYIVVWKYFQKPVRLMNIKYVHLGDRAMPDQQE